ncbi:GNAT family N-acetyltransferase [Flavivirga aquatica]|uniref:GNAT family N-acetyltransferase n=1 Tax=Flavivirga aquatica TaxID=1849968 RepID=UPI001F0AAC6E|nr:GNAT family N-acetyltransferase [Flavivirga aquatica]
MDYKIRLINTEEAYIIRHSVLRVGKPIESCAFDGDNLETTFHFGIFLKNDLIGVCTFLKNSNNLITETSQYQLRGMAILEKFQKKGLGNVILNYGENFLKTKNTQIIWCNAREKASNFYKKSHYKIIGNPFNIKEIGIHYIMYKVL